ncbi:hypothetical protein NDU88_000629 [Pleurodeles waltl]|uniref:Uncharacterized protein n=1 Tax=Pleurodeles waltl TaxID=8319 RepID=A0AAV7KPF0_PLEWA|nr:hypothetical protein NDU88_000629 [Pleurodeles waltl]
MRSGVQAARSLSPHRRHVSPHIGPQGARAPDRRAGVRGVLHRAAASAGEPPTSGSAERRAPGRHLEFFESAAAGAITAQICRRLVGCVEVVLVVFSISDFDARFLPKELG